MQKKLILLLALFLLSSDLLGARTGDKNLGWPGKTLSGTSCYGPAQGYGPFDYTDPNQHVTPKSGGVSSIKSVENFHFTPKVESLRGGATSIDAYGDLVYTINAFPNHHRALWAMSRYYLRALNKVGLEVLQGRERAAASPAPPECFFNRAKLFAPNDHVIEFIYGLYLHKRGDLDMALEKYQVAEQKLASHSELIYNMGLLHLDMGNLDKAKEYAAKAAKLKYPLRGLENRIKREENKTAN